MDSLEDVAFSSDNWLLNYIEVGNTTNSPLDSRVRTRMWILHHFFSTFAKSKPEKMENERELQHEESYCQDRYGNRLLDGGKVERAGEQRIVRKCRKIGRGSVRADSEKRETVSGQILNLKLKGRTFDPKIRQGTEPTATASCIPIPPPGVYPEVGKAAREYHLPVNYVELPDTTSNISSLQSTCQPSHCNNFWTEVFFNSTRYLVLSENTSRVVSTGSAAQNHMNGSSALTAGSRISAVKNRKRKRDVAECGSTPSSAKRLHS